MLTTPLRLVRLLDKRPYISKLLGPTRRNFSSHPIPKTCLDVTKSKQLITASVALPKIRNALTRGYAGTNLSPPSSTNTKTTTSSLTPAAKGSGSFGLVLLLLLLALFISTLALYFGNNPLFSPLMKLLVGISNRLNKKLKVGFSSVNGSIRDGTLDFSDFHYTKTGKHKSAKVALKRLLVKTKESPFEVLKQGIDKKLQDRFTLSDYVAEDGTVEIEVRSVGTLRPDPKVLFERMRVRDLKVHFYDHTLPNVSGRVAFPVDHIHSLDATSIHTDSPGTLMTDMFLNGTIKGTMGGNPYELKPRDWHFDRFPVGFVGDFLQAPLKWFSGASADIHIGTPRPPQTVINPVTGKEERVVEFVTRVAFKDLHPVTPKELKAEDLQYLPLVEILKKKSKGEYTIEYSTTLRESELNKDSLQRALTDAMIRDLVNASIQKGLQLFQEHVLPAAKNALENYKTNKPQK